MANERIGPPPARGRPGSAKRQVGFTLIEVVVAFVLLSLVLVSVFELFSTGLARAGELDDYSRALVVAQSRLAAAGTEEATVAEGESRGDTDDGRFHWTTTIRRHDDGIDPSKPSPGAYAMYRIDVRVAWQGADRRDRDLALATLVLGPRT